MVIHRVATWILEYDVTDGYFNDVPVHEAIKNERELSDGEILEEIHFAPEITVFSHVIVKETHE